MTAPSPAKRAAKKASRKAAAPRPGTPTRAERDAQRIADAEEAIRQLGEMEDSPIGPDGEIRPVVIGKKGKKGPERVHIFTLDDEDYFIPKVISPALMIKFQRDLRRTDRESAVWGLVETLLGKEAIDALAESPDTSPEDLAAVFTIVATQAFGSLKKLQATSDPS